MAAGLEKTLRECKRLVDAEIVKTIPKGKKPFEVYGLIWDFLERGGKRIRPAFCLICAEAVGKGGRKKAGSQSARALFGEAKGSGDVVIGKNALAAVPAATCIELFHNFTLIHDDIEDNSLMRRGKPCLHVAYGLPLAINAGDGLFMMAWKAVLGLCGAPKRQALVQRKLHDVFTAVLEGQAIELQWHKNGEWDISEKDYLMMVEGKTGALIAGSCEAGAIIGGGSAAQVKSLYDFGMLIGTAFQVQDDVLNIVGDEKEYKKEIWGDITEGKRTIMVLHAIGKASSGEKKFLSDALDAHTTDRERMGKAVKVMEKYGSIEYARKASRKMIKEAYGKLECLPEGEAKESLRELARFLVERKV